MSDVEEEREATLLELNVVNGVHGLVELVDTCVQDCLATRGTPGFIACHQPVKSVCNEFVNGGL